MMESGVVAKSSSSSRLPNPSTDTRTATDDQLQDSSHRPQSASSGHTGPSNNNIGTQHGRMPPSRSNHLSSNGPSNPTEESNGLVRIGNNNIIKNCTCLPNHSESTSTSEHRLDDAGGGDSSSIPVDSLQGGNHVNGTMGPPEGGEAMDTVNIDAPLRQHSKVRDFRNARSEILTSELYRRRSASMMEVKEQAHGRLQEELDKAQRELKLKDEECEKLGKVRDQMCRELEELTACLFEEANNMVQEANMKRMHSEKLQSESAAKIEILQAEVLALKQIVLTSTPATPNKHLHPQIEATPTAKKKESRPFWKGHRRSTSHHEFTKESRQEAEARQQESIRVVEVDPVSLLEFRSWRQSPQMSRKCNFLSRVVFEDIAPCLNFASKELAERVQQCVETNTLTIEPISGDSSFPRKCSLSESPKLCNYKIKLGEDARWFPISQHCRNRIASVCDFYTYIRYVFQGLVKSEDKDVYNEILRLRRQMALARLGLL